MLQVEKNGEAWYVNPRDYKKYYLGRPADAFKVMRELGVGITNKNIEAIKVNVKYNLYKVVEVVDGDTIKVSIDGKSETIRMIGIDTPESVHPTKPVQCFGLEASNKTKSLLLNKNVKLLSDDSQGDKDKYNRMLRFVFLENGTNFNETMIKEGYGYEYTYSKAYKFQTQFKNAEAEAKNNKKGLWADGACATSTTNKTEDTTTSTNSSKHTYYTSSHYSSKLYYCDTDKSWEGLSKDYLKTYISETELLKTYPTKTLNEPCK